MKKLKARVETRKTPLPRKFDFEIAEEVALLLRLCPDDNREKITSAVAEQWHTSVRRVRSAFAEFEDAALAIIERAFNPPSVKKEKGKGRPKGARKLPPDYLLHMLELCRRKPSGISLSQWCREIVKGVQLVDARTGQVAAKFTNWRTLRSRLIEAQKIARATNYRARTFPDTPFGALTAHITSSVSFTEEAKLRTLEHSISWAGKSLLRVPPPKYRRQRVAKLSKLSGSVPK
jgi:hypothetical protein